MAGNANFDGFAAFSTFIQMSKEWTSIWRPALPLLSIVKGRQLTFNKARDTTNGTKAIVPIVYLGPATGSRVQLDSNWATAITPTGTQGFTQAEYFYSTREGALWNNYQERNQNRDPAQLMSVLPAKTRQLMEKFASDWSGDLMGTQNCDGRAGSGKIMAERYPLSTSNSPGNISQSTYTVWQAGVVSSAGPFGLHLINAQRNRIKDLGRGAPDFVQLSYASGRDLFDKMWGLLDAKTFYTNPKSKEMFGFETFTYQGMECFMDGRLGDVLPGSMIIGSSDTWWVNMRTDEPVPADRDAILRMEGTTTDEHMFVHEMMVGISDPARNSLVTDIV